MAASVSRTSVLVFDIGGTNIRAAAWSAGGAEPPATDRRLTPNFINHPELSPDELVDAVLHEMGLLSRDLLGGAAPSTVVVGWPGPVTPEGVSLRSPTIFGPRNDRPVEIGARAARLWPSSSVVALNDLTCAGYAYVAKGYRDFCIFTVGSGIANKIFADGRPLLGPNGRGGEVGHLAAWLGPDWPEGLVPTRTHLGDIASGRGALSVAQLLAQRYPKRFQRSALGPNPTGFDNEALVSAFRTGDVFARDAIRLCAQALTHAIASVHVLTGCERVFLTGGFATALGEQYRQMLVAEAADLTWDLGQDWDAIIELGHDADGLRGAEEFARAEILHEPCRPAA